ncbi:hypothetical protein B0H11DRAFT_2191709 [Mycena galericulata]|nr:hypothetical protein B0H11DRAFT_2191709 [Mycena galericulata]
MRREEVDGTKSPPIFLSVGPSQTYPNAERSPRPQWVEDRRRRVLSRQSTLVSTYPLAWLEPAAATLLRKLATVREIPRASAPKAVPSPQARPRSFVWKWERGTDTQDSHTAPTFKERASSHVSLSAPLAQSACTLTTPVPTQSVHLCEGVRVDAARYREGPGLIASDHACCRYGVPIHSALQRACSTRRRRGAVRLRLIILQIFEGISVTMSWRVLRVCEGLDLSRIEVGIDEFSAGMARIWPWYRRWSAVDASSARAG